MKKTDKNYRRSLGENYDWAKKLFKKLQTDAKRVLFTEKTINDKVLKKLTQLRYNKDIKFVNLCKSNINFLDYEKNLSQ